MAIWPFGRKGKRPRSQMKASDAADRRLSLEDPVDKLPTLVARKPSRKRSKRDKHRSAGSLRQQSSPPPAPPPRAAAAEPERAAARPIPFAYNLDNQTSLSSIGQDNFTVARPTPMLQRRSNSTATKGTTLKKRLSKRSARDIQREQEIKALSSSPPPNPPHAAATWGYLASDIRRGPSVHSRNADHHASNQSLPMDSRSSMSESSDYLYTYKVNALAVLAPRPIIRYSEHHNKLPPRSANPSSNSMRHRADEEDWNSHKRVAELADDLDATALRELLERDRRRKEKKRQQEQERKQRRLQRRLEREHEQPGSENADGLGIMKNNSNNEEETEAHELRGRDKTPSPATSSKQFHPENNIEEEDSAYVQSGSWLRESSKDTQNRENRFSDISAHVIGNIDDRSIRAGKLVHDVNAQSEDEASRHRSPLYQAVASTSSARMSSVAQESFSDLSRTEISEKRLSDTSSSRRMASWISFFRRPSLRKRSSREVDAPPSEFSNTSRDSFMRTQSHTKPAVPIPIPERSFRRTGTVYRSQSKFVEHLGDYPISPPDSRMQSPTPAPLEAVVDMPAVDELETGPSPRRSFTDVEEEYKYENENENQNDDGRSRPMSWDDNSVMLSQSLASIDSEGSWMSGNFLRRISQQQNSNNYTSWRSSTGKKMLMKYDEAEENDEEGLASDEYLDELAEESAEEESNSIPDVRRASSSARGPANTDGLSEDSSRPSSKDNTSGLETWHGVVLERKPTVVRRASGRARIVSNEVVLGDYDMLDTSSIVDEDNASPISQESETVEVKRALSVDLGRGHKHARQISAGSAKLLDIPRRASVGSSRQ
ncbi:hypothetical protein UA08_06485 [Talaromyces atroroseus]|uniref:Uncharacterized protein n=1 Tax=Talaromyces atroroseus TaxID=1441469 RepID=A0A225AFU4_TALAT|nr:hypothetical protein UA08_06485 [Talaromyces atroroseus]OKL58013.1 hypothetical protein UA08_06485 [Talaromyces atroroseus]